MGTLCSEFVTNHFLYSQTQNRRFRAVFRGGQEFSDPKIVLSKGPLEKTLEIRRFCVLLHKKWFGTNSEHAFVSSAEWFGTKLLSSECFSHLRNRSGTELLHTSEVVFALIFPLFILL
jgi:hypothetical protein